MAFRVNISIDQFCDACKQINATDPMVLLYSSAERNDRNLIYVHEKCLEKAIRNAKRRRDRLESTKEAA